MLNVAPKYTVILLYFITLTCTILLCGTKGFTKPTLMRSTLITLEYSNAKVVLGHHTHIHNILGFSPYELQVKLPDQKRKEVHIYTYIDCRESPLDIVTFLCEKRRDYKTGNKGEIGSPGSTDMFYTYTYICII